MLWRLKRLYYRNLPEQTVTLLAWVPRLLQRRTNMPSPRSAGLEALAGSYRAPVTPAPELRQALLS